MDNATKTALLLDTNVWIDYYIGVRAGHQAAFELVDYAIRNGIELLYMAGSLKDVFYILAEAQKREARLDRGSLAEGAASAINEIAWSCIDSMTALATPIPLDLRTIWIAQRMKGLHRDFEDCLVLAACELGPVSFLVTSDRQLLEKSPTAAMTAGDVLGYLRIR